MKDKLSAHQETISILSKQKEAQIKLYKTWEDKELEKVIELENKVKVLDNIVYKIGQTFQTMNMLNNKYRTSFAKPEFLKKAQRANPRLYDIGCYNDNLALMLAPDSDEVIRIEKESRSKLSDLIRPFDYEKLNNLINRNVGYENQRIGNVDGARETVGSTVVQKSEIQCYNCKEFWHVARECQKMKRAKDVAYHRERMLLYVADSGPIFDDEPVQKVSNDDHYNVFAMESVHPEQSKYVHDTYHIEQDAQNVIIDLLDMNYDREEIDQNNDDNDLAKERELLASIIEKLKCEIDESKNRNKFLETSNKALIDKLKGEIEDFKNKNISLESSNNFFKEANNRLSETNNLLYTNYKKSEAELARRNSKEYASQMKLECAEVRGLETELSKSKMMSKSFESVQKYAINLELELQQCQENIKNEKFFTVNQTKDFCKEREQYFEIQDLKAQLQDKDIIIITAQTLPTNKKSILKNTNVLAPGMLIGLNVLNRTKRARVMHNNSQGKKQAVEDQRRSVKFSKNKTFATACNDSLNAKTLNVNLNDQMAPIIGYGDLVQGVVTIKRVYYVEGLNHNLFSIGQFYDADLEVAFRKSTCFIRDLKGNELLIEGILHQTSVARTPEQNGVVERRNRTLVEAARTILSAVKVPLFFWSEAISTACFTQNRSLVIPCHEKTPYHIINERKPS
nr:retrovirus-related Pol polyprotein from transposon TNT 1-94 [Tanacetum cinerariifolium]